MKDIRMTAIAAALLLCACTTGNTPAQTQSTSQETSAVSADTTASEETSAETSAETSGTTTASQTEAETTAPETTAESETEMLAPVAGGGYAAAYKEKLQSVIDEHKNDDLSTYMFSLYDVGGDETPELFLSEGDYHVAAAQLFAYIDGKVEEIGYVGSYGETIYMPERKQFDNANGGMGSFYNGVAEFDGRELKYGLTIEAYEGPDYEAEEPSYDEMIEKYFINDEKVTKEEYYKAYEDNFSGTCISLGRSFYLNEHSLTAVFDDIGSERGFDEIILSLPTSGEQWGVPKEMSYIDIMGNGTEQELVLTNGYSYNVYTYDKGVKCAGSIPIYSYSPYQYYDEIDIDYEYSDDPEVTLAVNPKNHSIMYRQRSGSETISSAVYKDGVLYPDGEYHAYKLTNGTYYYTIDSKPADESEYDSRVQGFFSDDYKVIDFYPVAVG